MIALIVGFSVGAFVYGSVVIVKRALRKHKKKIDVKEE